MKGMQRRIREQERDRRALLRAGGAIARATGGMGLGLAIVQEAMAVMDGSLSIANRPRRGLRVVLRLPLMP